MPASKRPEMVCQTLLLLFGKLRAKDQIEELDRCGAPRIHGELLKLGFEISERTVARYLRRRGDPGKRWLAFLQNHREVIAAFDFFTVPALTFRLLYCFSVIEHGRRRILHFNITRHPSAAWVVQQLREVFPEAAYVILHRDSKFDHHVITFLTATRTFLFSEFRDGTLLLPHYNLLGS